MGGFWVVLTQQLEVLAILIEGGGGAETFHSLKGGGGGEKFYPVLIGGHNKFQPHDFPIL